MTPTAVRDWERVDGALAGVLAFADIDKAVGRAEESLPGDAATARQLATEAPDLRADAERCLTDARDLRAHTASTLTVAAEMRGDLRDLRRRLRRRVFALRVRVAWLRVSRAVGGAAWWVLMALPRLFRWLWRMVSSPFRSSPLPTFDDDDRLPRGRVR